ncbi:MAG: LysR family transcriptional regulator [Bauldia sp.]|nr:LysR family transcriptional regulator [Bauldia sp.]
MIGSLTLDQLRVLVAIADSGSFSAAGRQLRRVQSAISQTVQGLEETQGVVLFDRAGRIPRLTDAGRILVREARLVLEQAREFEAVAEGIASGLEPELGIALDGMCPTPPVMASLQRLRALYPTLAVSLFTEGLGAAERRLRSGDARLAITLVIGQPPSDLQALELIEVTLVPVVAASHPLAAEPAPVPRAKLREHVQLVLTDPVDPSGPSYSIVSPTVWRFVDLGRRLDFLLAGFGWCTMPGHLVAPHIASGALKPLVLDEPPPPALPVYAVFERGRPPGRAGRWLLEDLAKEFASA